MEKLHKVSVIEVGSSIINAEMGLPQGSVLSPALFNVYLEDALDSSNILQCMRKRGDLLAFADDMLIMSNQKSEIEEAINGMAYLKMKYNLRLNKKKSEILTSQKEQEINGIRCTNMVKYLGVKICMELKT